MTPTQFSGHCLENWIFNVKLSAKVDATFAKTLAIPNFQSFAKLVNNALP
jgi:hypothetical protein